MKKWDYENFEIRDGETTLSLCKRVGQKGWELVAITDHNPPKYYFKREIPEQLDPMSNMTRKMEEIRLILNDRAKLHDKLGRIRAVVEQRETPKPQLKMKKRDEPDFPLLDPDP